MNNTTEIVEYLKRKGYQARIQPHCAGVQVDDPVHHSVPGRKELVLVGHVFIFVTTMLQAMKFVEDRS